MSLDRLHLMAVFVAVGEEGGFSAAARRLSMSPPMVTRAVATLEQRLGVKLLNRTTRHVRLTEVGRRYTEEARRIVADAEAADAAASGSGTQPQGTLSITAPALFGKMFVMPHLLEYLHRYPKVELSALFVDRVVNLVGEGIDIAIRIGELPDSGMRAVRLGQVQRVTCASPRYLARNGAPQVPADLGGHTIVLASGLRPALEWKFIVDGMIFAVRVKPRLTVSTNDGALEAVRAGFGIASLMSYQVGPYIASGELVAVLQRFQCAPLPVSLLHHEGSNAPARVRAFVDLIADGLRGDPTFNQVLKF